MRIIKWFDDPYFEQTVTLGLASFMITCCWNVRDEAWYVSVYKSDETPLVIGKKLTIDVNVLSDVYDDGKPDGGLYAIVMGNNIDVITRNNMGSEVELVYIGDDEVL